ncbi:MAG: ExeM/NucH family extracellular endonuclease, partial [Elainellaceae cyanobacterium]
MPEFTDGSADFFTRTDGSNISGSYEVTGADGSFYFAAQDIDGEGAAPEQTLSFSGIDITNLTNLSVSALFAEDDSSDGNEDWDAPDFVKVEYQIDGGGFSNVLAIENDGATFNTAPFIDTDFDGVGDGAEITATFVAFSNAIAGTGSSLDLRFTFDLDSGDEDIAVDAIQVTGDEVAAATPLISEFQPNPTGTDPSTTTVELSGTPGESFEGTLVSIESDPGNPGVVDRVATISGTFDANGLLTANISDLENPSFTLALLDNFTGNTSTDIDTDDDGVADDLSTFETVFDAIGIPDTTGEPLYGAQLGGTDFAFTGDEPRLVFRDASVGDLYAVNDPDNGEVIDVNGNSVAPSEFDSDPTTGPDTFGAVNPSRDGNNNGGTTLAIAPDNAAQAEGDAGTTDFTFTVTRSGDTSGATSVDFAVSGAADAADFGGALPSNTVNFASGETSQTITVGVSGDTDAEPDEGFTVTLSNPSNGATISAAAADGTIQNDDGVAVTLISDIQGSGDASPLEGQTVTVSAIVTGDFQDGNAGTDGDLNGFFLQEEDADADGTAATSEGIFVFGGSSPAVDVNIGDQVTVTGTVSEFFGKTQISADTVTVVSSGSALPTAATVDLPTASTVQSGDELIADLEQFEGMRVTFGDTLTVDEYFNYDRFGEIRLTEGDRPFQFTQTNAPSVSGFQAFQEDLASRSIVLDDGQTSQNPDNLPYPAPGFSNSNFFRGGDTVTNLSGVLDFGFDAYRVQPTSQDSIAFQSTNPRPDAPENVGGSLKVASFNVLNYFTTLDTGATTANGSDPRGADSQAEFERQTDKLVTAVLGIDADILGLVELENDFLPGSSGNAVETLVEELNAVAGAGTYDWVNPGQQFVDSGDAISVGAIYKTASVAIADGTNPAILRDDNLPSGFEGEQIFDGVSTNRAPLAVSFTEIATGESLTIAVNHFKSKGSIFNQENAAIGDGQGNNNPIRLRAAQAVDAWLETDPTGSGDSDFLILGDLNAYAQEDPITFLESEGYTDLAEQFSGGETPYSFLFDGQLGTLDYALANEALLSQVTGATEWHVNADEVDVLDYNLDFGRSASFFNGDDPYRNSDHDPLIIGLNLSSPDDVPQVNGQDATIYVNAAGIIVGNAFFAGEPYQGDLFSNTDAEFGTGESPDDVILGTNGADNIYPGVEGVDLIDAAGGDDIIGFSGGDTVFAASGDDFA